MRDIRKGLEQRLGEAEAERAQIGRRIARLDEKSALLKQILEYEKAYWHSRDSSGSLH